MDAITIRRSTERDIDALARLAALDSRHTLQGDTLLAFEGDELRAALELRSGSAVADPFAPSAELVGLLRTRAGLVPVEKRRIGRLGRFGAPLRKARLA